MSDKPLPIRIILALRWNLSLRERIKEARECPQLRLLWVNMGKGFVICGLVGVVAIATGYGIARAAGPNHWLGRLLLRPTYAEIALVFMPIGGLLGWLAVRLALVLRWVQFPKRGEKG